jgi:diacylglycerol kinase (ATP)
MNRSQRTKPSYNLVRRLSGNILGAWRRRGHKNLTVVILNPAVGQDHPVLKTINNVFQSAGIDWDVLLTKQAHDGMWLAQKSVSLGAKTVAVYGGDGTVTDVASGLAGSKIPLGIIPGGTTNMISTAFGIPRDLTQACSLIAQPKPPTRRVYIGQVNRFRFIQMVGIGMEARMIEGAVREAKERLGIWAYGLAALNALNNPPITQYHMVLDGKMVNVEGVTCVILNVDNLNIPFLSTLPPHPRNGLLDIFIVRKADLRSIISVAATMVGAGIDLEILPHWQARQVYITTDPPQPVQGDGEMLGQTPVFVRVPPNLPRSSFLAQPLHQSQRNSYPSMRLSMHESFNHAHSSVS